MRGEGVGGGGRGGVKGRRGGGGEEGDEVFSLTKLRAANSGNKVKVCSCN